MTGPRIAKPSVKGCLKPTTSRDDVTSLGASGQLAAIHELVGLFIKIVPTVNPNELVTLFEQRERFNSTATIDGVAFPFAELNGIDEPILALACSRDGVDFGSPRGELTELFVALVTL